MWNRLKGPWGGDDGSRRELDEEMAFHLDRLTDDLIAEGMDPDAARREAVRRFGNPERVQERARQERGLALFDELRRNVSFAVRGLVRDPVHTATFVLTTALIVALGGMAWAVGEATLWRSLPYPESERLVHATLVEAGSAEQPLGTAVDGATWFQFDEVAPEMPRAVYTGWASGVNLSAEGAAAYVNQQRVGAGYFEVLGVAPARGREFRPSEDVAESPSLAILSHGLWATTFGSDPDLLGSTIRLKGEPHTVVGIMPEGFRSAADADLWTPLRPSRTGEGSGTNYTIVARLPEGLTPDEARARFAALPAPEEWTRREGDWGFGLVSLEEASKRGARTPITVLLGGIGVMVLIGWANLAGLQIARTLGRASELATRRALGGGVAALVRQLSVESLAVAGLGGVLGTAALLAAAPAVEVVLESRFGSWQPFASPATLVLVAGALTLAAALVSAVAPVVHAARPGLTRAVVSGRRVRGRSRSPARALLLVGQLALVTVLVFSAGLLARSYGHLDGLDRGFDPEGVLTVQYSLDDARFADADAVRGLFRRSLAELEARPEVASAAVALTLPYERPLNLVVRHPGEEANLLTNVVYVTPGFFETLRIPLLRGRVFDDRDGPEAPPVAVANQAFVDRYMEGRDPLVSAVHSGDMGERSIVGVVGNVQQAAGWGDASRPVWETPTLYVAAEQLGPQLLSAVHVWFAPSWVVRGNGDDPRLAAAVAEVFRGVASELAVARTATLDEVVDRAFARQRLEAGFLAAVAVFALILAGVGLYGLVSQQALERRGEMGVRMALGASPRSTVLRTGVGGLRLALVGLVTGMVLSVPAARLLDSLVFGVGTWEPATLLAPVAILGLLGAAASFVPALRIGRLDPARVLQAE